MGFLYIWLFCQIIRSFRNQPVKVALIGPIQMCIRDRLEGFRDFTLDGGGSRWVFHAQMLPCRVAHSSGVRLENFSLDLARPVYSEGVIREVRPQQMTVWIDPEKYPWHVENGRLVFTGENFRRAMHLWLEMDAKTRAPAWGCLLYTSGWSWAHSSTICSILSSAR